MRARLVQFAAVAGAAAQAAACPLCDSDRAAEVRAALNSAESVPAALAILAPFVIVGLVLAVADAWLKPRPADGADAIPA